MNARWLVFSTAGFVAACGAVFPEISPPVKSPPAGRELAPPPPSDLLFLAFAGADIPEKTRDGRKWDSMGGSAPDPFAKLFVDDREIVRTPVQSDTLSPTWPDQKRGNYRISKEAHIRVELWDSNPLNNHPICLKKIHSLPEQASPFPVDIECESGAHVRLRVEPAHARWGLGFSYELRTVGVGVTRVLAESPAARAGLKSGDEIVEIAGKKVAKMEEGEPQSLINANAQVGVDIVVRGADHADRPVKLAEGVIYPVFDEGVPVE
jgi:hypothetical protein